MIHGTKAVIRSHQGFADDKSLLSVQSVEHQGGRVLFTASVPEEIFPLISNLLQNGISLANYVGTQNRVSKAIQKTHDPVEIQKRQDEYEKYAGGILSKFDSFVSSGSPCRQAIKQTKEFFQKKGSDITCHIIELMLSERKRTQKGRKK